MLTLLASPVFMETPAGKSVSGNDALTAYNGNHPYKNSDTINFFILSEPARSESEKLPGQFHLTTDVTR